MTSAPLTLRALNRATLARQLLLEREKTPVVSVLERLAGLQAQWPKPPFVGLWTRLADFRREDLAAALADRSAVRATMMRGTIHLVSAADYLAFRPALAPVLESGMESILRQRGQELDVDALVSSARKLYAEGPRTFEEVRDHLLAENPGADERAMGFAVRMRLPLVQVPDDSPWSFPSIPRFAVAESWLGKPIPEDGNLGELVRRYLAAFGPASVADAQTWSGIKGLRPVFETLRPELITFRDERRRELFDLPDAPRPAEDTPAPVRFLPEYDNLLLAHDDRKRIVADEHKKKVFLPGLRVAATYLVDGFVAGAWKAERKRKVARLLLQSFEELGKKDRAQVEEEGEKLLRFLDPDAESFEIVG